MKLKNILINFVKITKFISSVGFHVIVLMTPIIALYAAMRTDPPADLMRQLGLYFICWLLFSLYYIVWHVEAEK